MDVEHGRFELCQRVVVGWDKVVRFSVSNPIEIDRFVGESTERIAETGRVNTVHGRRLVNAVILLTFLVVYTVVVWTRQGHIDVVLPTRHNLDKDEEKRGGGQGTEHKHNFKTYNYTLRLWESIDGNDLPILHLRGHSSQQHQDKEQNLDIFILDVPLQTQRTHRQQLEKPHKETIKFISRRLSSGHIL